MRRVPAMIILVGLLARTALCLGNVLNYAQDRWSNIGNSNYFLTGLGSTDAQSGPSFLTDAQNQVKFRIQLNYRIVGEKETMSGLYFGYTQLSFWRVYDTDRPIDGNSYGPALSLYYEPSPLLGEPWYAPSARLSLAHESNGLTGDDGRSWDRLIAGLEFPRLGTSALSAEIAVWHVLRASLDRKLLRENLGDGEVRLSWTPTDVQSAVGFGATAAARFVYGEPYIANVELSVVIDPFNRLQSTLRWLPSFMVQYYFGTGENLTHFTRSSSVLRFGVSFL